MKRILITALIPLSFMATTVLAGEAKVTFKNVEKYTDFSPATGIESRFQEKTKEDFTEKFNELAGLLPKGQTFDVTVTDVDLTGRVEPTFGQSATSYIRVVRPIDFPRMNLTYKLIDDQGEVIKEDSVVVKDMGFDMSSMASIKRQRNINYYEHKMLEDWFRETFSEQIKANQPGGAA
ncbi:hypothetical protein DFP83_106134 [Idiomarina fontislapidosi]|uniref:DUF3016 domain-containing protein n=1 Tax=Idiomarina fontislapidosi TaxID=263723 RepID=A0A432Y810_9GAMM|nr:DUF3016 domain-containing protein [Idiomarina fontislapidosi]PYE32407.1 hypothetical protein DFP83_106134 [Idiomarina fontislapidosi]RUO57110.1 DUF3016 domain-containing protein [Idiomarina fontislapidosi]